MVVSNHVPIPAINQIFFLLDWGCEIDGQDVCPGGEPAELASALPTLQSTDTGYQPGRIHEPGNRNKIQSQLDITGRITSQRGIRRWDKRRAADHVRAKVSGKFQIVSETLDRLAGQSNNRSGSHLEPQSN